MAQPAVLIVQQAPRQPHPKGLSLREKISGTALLLLERRGIGKDMVLALPPAQELLALEQ